MAEVINQIRSWATAELRYWERVALEKVSERRALTELDLEELVQCYLQDAGLVSSIVARPQLSFPDNLVYEAKLAPCRLERLFNLKNVNALPDNQEIRFGPQLTLIYGDNGTGKTGYTRPLASAGFARGEREVLPNAELDGSKDLPRADIEVSQGGSRSVVTWTSGQRCPELSGFYIFDAMSLNAHLTKSNSLSFSPGGLSLLTDLAETTDAVRTRVRLLINQREAPRDFQSVFEGESETSKLIKTLSTQTDFSLLEKMANLSDEEIKAASDLGMEIARLKLLNVPKRIAQLEMEMKDLGNLIVSIGRAQAALGESVQTDVQRLIESVKKRGDELERSGTQQFTSEAFSQIGTNLWVSFLNAAKELADAESKRGTSYPDLGDRCALCWQPLSPDAIKLIQRFWEFLESDAQGQLETAQQACAAKARELGLVSLNYFASDSSVR
ncbi:MAG: ATP-binding protein [Acidobacteriia bacterium]|nr:ATP-binding protein [Terriglobia bacterium]